MKPNRRTEPLGHAPCHADLATPTTPARRARGDDNAPCSPALTPTNSTTTRGSSLPATPMSVKMAEMADRCGDLLDGYFSRRRADSPLDTLVNTPPPHSSPSSGSTTPTPPRMLPSFWALPSEIHAMILSEVLASKPSGFLDVRRHGTRPDQAAVFFASKQTRRGVLRIIRLDGNGCYVLPAGVQRNFTLSCRRHDTWDCREEPRIPGCRISGRDMVLVLPRLQANHIAPRSVLCCSRGGHNGVLVPPSWNGFMQSGRWLSLFTYANETGLVLRAPPQASVSDDGLVFKQYFRGYLDGVKEPCAIGTFFCGNEDVTQTVAGYWYDSGTLSVRGILEMLRTRLQENRDWEDSYPSSGSKWYSRLYESRLNELVKSDGSNDAGFHHAQKCAPVRHDASSCPRVRNAGQTKEAEPVFKALVLMTSSQVEEMNKPNELRRVPGHGPE